VGLGGMERLAEDLNVLIKNLDTGSLVDLQQNQNDNNEN